VSAAAATIPARMSRRGIPVRRLLIVAGALLAALVLAFVGTNAWTSIQQRSLEDRFDAAAASWATLDAAGRSSLTFAPGEPVARIGIASIGLDAIVVEGATPSLMRRAPGHLAGSATPGESGIAIITANRIGFGGFFLRLDRLAVGDRIVTESAFGTTTYTVTEVRTIPATQLDLRTDSSRRVLMLIGSSRLAGGSDRLVVTAVAGGA
jgi:sortase A